MQQHPKLWLLLLLLYVLQAGEGTNYLCNPCITPSLCCRVRIRTSPHHQKIHTMHSWVLVEFLALITLRWQGGKKKPLNSNLGDKVLGASTRWAGEEQDFCGSCEETRRSYFVQCRFIFCHFDNCCVPLGNTALWCATGDAWLFGRQKLYLQSSHLTGIMCSGLNDVLSHIMWPLNYGFSDPLGVNPSCFTPLRNLLLSHIWCFLPSVTLWCSNEVPGQEILKQDVL